MPAEPPLVPWRLEWRRRTPRYRYRVAGLDLSSVLDLDPCRPHAGPPDGSPSRELPAATPSLPIWSGAAWLGGSWRSVECRRCGDGYELGVADFGHCRIVPAERRIVLLTPPDDLDAVRELAVEIALGPAVLLALADRGTFAWHASAAEVGGRLVGFLGESGRGKSTLARSGEADGESRWTRVADDVLPVDVPMAESSVWALPDFPQLKLSADEQYPADRVPRRELGAVFVLAPEPAAERSTVECERLSTRDAALALIRHTVASKLFDRRLLERHVALSAEASGRLPVFRLRYRFDLAELVNVRDAVRRAG